MGVQYSGKDQAERFLAQVAEKDAGDEEAMHYDADYIRALNTACRQLRVKVSVLIGWLCC